MMLLSYWSVSSENFDVDAFLRRQDYDVGDRVFYEGASKADGSVNQTSGFVVCVADSKNQEEHVKELMLFLEEDDDILKSLCERGIRSHIKIGMLVGRGKNHVGEIELPSELLVGLGQYGVALWVLAYPSSGPDERS